MSRQDSDVEYITIHRRRTFPLGRVNTSSEGKYYEGYMVKIVYRDGKIAEFDSDGLELKHVFGAIKLQLTSPQVLEAEGKLL